MFTTDNIHSAYFVLMQVMKIASSCRRDSAHRRGSTGPSVLFGALHRALPMLAHACTAPCQVLHPPRGNLFAVPRSRRPLAARVAAPSRSQSHHYPGPPTRGLLLAWRIHDPHCNDDAPQSSLSTMRYSP